MVTEIGAIVLHANINSLAPMGGHGSLRVLEGSWKDPGRVLEGFWPIRCYWPDQFQPMRAYWTEKGTGQTLYLWPI